MDVSLDSYESFTSIDPVPAAVVLAGPGCRLSRACAA